MSDDIRDHRLRFVLIGLFVLIAVLIGWDLLTDYRGGVNTPLRLAESAILLLATLGAAFPLRQFHTSRAELSEARDDALRWRQQNQEILSVLGAAIETQFTR